MGEDRNDRSGKRSSHGVDKSSSDTEIAQAKGKGRKTKIKDRWPFLEGLTVDELARYRRRRVQGHHKDNLETFCGSDVPDQKPQTEYRGAFRVSNEELAKLEDAIEGTEPSCHEDLKEHENIELPSRRKGPPASFVLVDGDGTMETQTESSRFVAHANPIGRPPLVRRGTTLKREGEFYTETEMYSSYVPYEGRHRAELARRPTSLKMEGDFDTMTEKCEKFIEWLNVSRPELMRVPTHLKLEGELEISTENHDKYVPFVGARRPELLRQSANLKLEGRSTFLPEYMDVFREHDVRERQTSRRPENHLKAGGDFFQATETTESYIDPRTKEAQLMDELVKDIEDEEEEERKKKEQEEREKNEEEMKMLVSKLEDLKTPPLEIPEYKDAYKDFPRERPKISKPDNEIGKADGSKVPSPTHPKFPLKLDQDPEYKSKYLDYPRDRPIYRKPPLALRPTQVSSNCGFGKSIYQEPEQFYYEPTSEVRSQYVPYGHVPRVETLKMPTNLRLEGNLELEPEYRNAYCTQRGYQSCGEPRMHRRRDRSLSASRKKDNYWMNNNNGEQFGRINQAYDQDAFQVLNTRVHEDNVVGKPPSGSRRGSRSSQIHPQRPTQLDIADSSVLRNRSPSPTYRLHVCNVDDEPRGFGRRRSPSFQSSGRIRSPSPDRTNQDVKPYSPSFGRSAKQQTDGQSFVVLDNAIDSNRNEARRRRTDKNCNVDSSIAISRRRPRTPTKWMPPWYDSTNTI